MIKCQRGGSKCKIALKQAELALMQKNEKETTAINGWNTVESAERACIFAEVAENGSKTYHVSYQKYFAWLNLILWNCSQHHLASIQAQQSSLNARINYL